MQVDLSKVELEALVKVTELGIKSGQMLHKLSSVEEGMAVVDALVKLKRALRDAEPKEPT